MPVYEVDRGMGEGIIKPHFCVPLSRPNGFETNDCRINYDDIWREGILCLARILEQHPRGARTKDRKNQGEGEREERYRWREQFDPNLDTLVNARSLIDFSKLYFLYET